MPTSKKMIWFAWVTASLFYTYQYILRVMPSVMLDDITRQFHIDSKLFGQYTGIYYIGYALMQLPIGIMLDRFGPRKVMTTCLVLTIAGLLPILVSDHWIYLLIGRGLIGSGSSAAILGLFYIIHMTFSEKHFSRMLSFSVTIGLLGAMYGSYPVGVMKQHLGYQTVVEIFCIMGSMLAGMTYWMVPDMKREYDTSTFAKMKTIFTHYRSVIILCCCAGLMVGPLEGFADVWGSAFLKNVYGVDATTANTLPSLIFIGMCFGGPILSMIAEKTDQYLNVIIAAGMIMCLAFVLLIAGMLTPMLIGISFFLVGLCCAYQILVIYTATTYVPKPLIGLTTTVANMIIMSFGYLFHTMIGFVIHLYGGITNVHAFMYGIGVIPITLAIGIYKLCRLAQRQHESPLATSCIDLKVGG